MVRIHLKQSKTDQMGQGAYIVLGKSGSEVCPVAAVLSYIACRGVQQGPFFLESKGSPVTKPTFIAKIRHIPEDLGIPQGYCAGHNSRIGAATLAAIAGVEDSTIQLLGRWQSAPFLRYVRIPQDRLAVY